MVKKEEKVNIDENLYEDSPEITDEMVEYIHAHTYMGPDGKIYPRTGEQTNDTIDENQRVAESEGLPAPDMDPMVMAERKTEIEKRNSMLIDTSRDIPQRIRDSELVWPIISHHNQLLQLSPTDLPSASRIRRNTVSIMRRMNWDRKNRKMLTASDQKNIVAFQEMMLSKSVGGFERLQQNREIVESVNIHKNDTPEQQSTNSNVISQAIDKFRGKK